jgi:hypothetical protein
MVMTLPGQYISWDNDRAGPSRAQHFAFWSPATSTLQGICCLGCQFDDNSFVTKAMVVKLFVAKVAVSKAPVAKMT